MKWKIFFSVTLWTLLPYLHFFANAQPYQSLFGDKDYPVQWIHCTYNFPSVKVTSHYEKDTIVQGVNYKKVVPTHIFTKGFSGGLFREDTASGHVWYRDLKIYNDPKDTLERLAFRFDLEVGDSFNISHTSRTPQLYPDTSSVVDSVKVVDGLKYIFFRARTHVGEPITLIEGVGSNLGIFWKHTNHNGLPEVRFGRPYLLCSYKNGEKTAYHNREFDGNCNPSLQIEDQKHELHHGVDIVLFPQPARESINIITKAPLSITEVQLINGQGQLIQNLSGDNIAQLKLHDLPPGQYFIKLFSNHKYLATKHLVVN